MAYPSPSCYLSLEEREVLQESINKNIIICDCKSELDSDDDEDSVDG
jgi:hypothetical protein